MRGLVPGRAIAVNPSGGVRPYAVCGAERIGRAAQSRVGPLRLPAEEVTVTEKQRQTQSARQRQNDTERQTDRQRDREGERESKP
eukprot:COSAG03_NODE_11319_length_599_cov_1.086000_1_plen_84_part_01